MSTPSPRFDVPRALRAIRALLADPDDLPQVFAILESLSGSTPERMVRRLKKTVEGRRLLAERPDITLLLGDREALRRLPEGSLGRAYLAFVESEGISAAGIQEADALGRTDEVVQSQEEAYLHRRMRDTHDLWHAVTGYQGDVLGEAALLGFSLAQTWNVGIALIMGAGLVKTAGKPASRAVILDGFHRGRRAGWFPSQPWESMLAEPLTEVRARLGVGRPAVYTPVRSADLKSAAA